MRKKLKSLVFLKYCFNIGRGYILLSLTNETLNTVIVLANVLVPKWIVDSLFDSAVIQRAALYIALLLVINCAGAGMTALLKYWVEKARDKMYTNYNISLAQSSLHVEYGFLEQSWYLNLRENAKKCMTSEYGFAGVLLLTVNLYGKLLLLVTLSIVLGQLNGGIVAVLLGLAVVGIAFSSRQKRKNIDLDLDASADRRFSSYLSALAAESATSREIRIYGLDGMVLGKLTAQLDKLRRVEERKNGNLFAAGSIQSVARLAQQGAMYAYLIATVVRQGMGQGDFVVYLSAINAINRALTDFALILSDLKNCIVYLKPFKAFYDLGHPAKGEISAAVPHGPSFQIEFDNVSFQYPGQQRWALKNVTMSIAAHEKILLAGENGAGKTTFVKLLLGLHPPTEGTIRVNGINIQTLGNDDYWPLFSVVFQDYKLLALPLSENITLGEPCESKPSLEAVLDAAGLRAWVDALPSGSETQIGKQFDAQGVEPSGGQGQNIAIARAIYRNAPIMILDEPTAMLDPRAEHEIYTRFQNMSDNRTTLLISHRLASARVCDRIFVFHDGGLAEAGSHQRLMEQGGRYADMFGLQAQYYRVRGGEHEVV